MVALTPKVGALAEKPVGQILAADDPAAPEDLYGICFRKRRTWRPCHCPRRTLSPRLVPVSKK